MRTLSCQIARRALTFLTVSIKYTITVYLQVYLLTNLTAHTTGLYHCNTVSVSWYHVSQSVITTLSPKVRSDCSGGCMCTTVLQSALYNTSLQCTSERDLSILYVFIWSIIYIGELYKIIRKVLTMSQQGGGLLTKLIL